MAFFQTIFIALLAVPTALAAPHEMPLVRTEMPLIRSAPQTYSGPASSFPAMSTWSDFNTTLSKYTPTMIAAGSTQGDVTNIGAACQSVASDQGIDARVLLALILQESTGYVGVTTTTNVDGAGTGGLMQASECEGYPGQSGLSADAIKTMISCGATHFATNYKSQGGQNTIDTIYPALREYNSGSVDTSDLSVAPNGAGVTSYVSDISQRLQGMVF